eukprot:4270793-Amphidinium_carterae.3
MFQINGDRVSRGTSLPIPVGDDMEIKTTFKCNMQRIIDDKAIYKTKHFHDLSIITTTEHYDPMLVPNCVIGMIKLYYSTEQKTNKQTHIETALSSS